MAGMLSWPSNAMTMACIISWMSLNASLERQEVQKGVKDVKGRWSEIEEAIMFLDSHNRFLLLWRLTITIRMILETSLFKVKTCLMN